MDHIQNNISKRLKTIGGMVEHKTLIDIGCDHALLPVYLLGLGIITKAIATDISAPSLKKGKENATTQGFAAHIDFIHADGMQGVDCTGFDTCVIAGMGGYSIISILDAAELSFKQLVLSPQRDVADVRKYLHSRGYSIYDEVMIEDGGKVYNIIDARQSNIAQSYSDAGYAFGEALINRKCPILREYIEKELRTTSHHLTGNLPQSRLKELASYKKFCEEVLGCIR